MQFFGIIYLKYFILILREERILIEKIFLEMAGIGMIEKWMKNKYIILPLIIGAVYFFLKYVCPLLAPVLIAVLFLTMLYPTLDDIQKF